MIHPEKKTLSELKGYFNEVASSWDGKESGIKEDNAIAANDIIDAIDHLENLIGDYNF